MPCVETPGMMYTNITAVTHKGHLGRQDNNADLAGTDCLVLIMLMGCLQAQEQRPVGFLG